MRHAAYVFDAYGTLFDVHSAVRKLADELGPAGQRVSEIWRAKQLEYTWVHSLAGRYRDFWTLTREALDFAIAVAAPDKTGFKPALLEAYRAIEAYPDARPALQRLKERGAQLLILSNGTPEMLATATASAGVAHLLDAVVSVDAIRSYKTDPRVYDLIGQHVQAERASISFQSSNRWDIAGAVACGFSTTWVNRTGQPDEYPDLPATRIIKSLDELDP